MIAYTALVYATLPATPWLRAFAAERFGSSVVTWFVVAALALAGAALAARALRGPVRLGFSGYASWAVIGLVYAGMMLGLSGIVVEQVHILLYGFMGVLVYQALDKRRTQREVFARAVAIVLGLGALDELIQAVLPNRVFDVRDIVSNGVSGLVAQLAILLARADRYTDVPPMLRVGDPRSA